MSTYSLSAGCEYIQLMNNQLHFLGVYARNDLMYCNLIHVPRILGILQYKPNQKVFFFSVCFSLKITFIQIIKKKSLNVKHNHICYDPFKLFVCAI